MLESFHDHPGLHRPRSRTNVQRHWQKVRARRGAGHELSRLAEEEFSKV
jgi:hypothetical protein